MTTTHDLKNPDAAMRDQAQGSARMRLAEVRGPDPVRVVEVDGDDALAARLRAAGLWPGVVVERVAAAPFGGPSLFRLHGYRLALRRDEAQRVQVVECGA